MNRKLKLITLAGFAGIALTACSSQEVSYSNQVQPILNKHCVQCHQPGGEGYIQSGLDLTGYDGLIKGTRLGKVVHPGSSIASTLVRLINHKADPQINMPKDGNKLAAAEINIIKNWIDQGAKQRNR